MPILGIDIETYSSVDLLKSGLHKYVESPDFEILMIAYKLGDDEVQIIDLASGEEVNVQFIHALHSPEYIKTAWNAQFEITCLSKYFNIELFIEQWECTMIKAAMISYPMSLDKCAKAMGLDVQKDVAGKALIKYFSVPCKPTITNGGRTRNLPHHDPIKWKAFKSYCIQDVAVEQSILDSIRFVKISDKERAVWMLDQKINNRGVMVDTTLVENAIKLNAIKRDSLIQEAVEITGLANPNSVAQLKTWIADETETEITNLNKENIKELIKEHDDEKVLRILHIRQELAKSSIKKYQSMIQCLGADCRVRGLLQYIGASKTGRWSARLIQLHNLPKNSMTNLDIARQLVRENNLDDLEMIFGNVSNTLSQLIRTAFIPSPGKLFLVSDFSAIEARVVAWFAGEEWRLDVFRGDGKIYEASGAQMFKVPIEEVKGDLRFKAKTAELALGYQGGVGAIVRMEESGLKTGLKPEEMQPLVNLWRSVNKKIVKFWYDVENAAIEAVDNPGIPVDSNYCKFIVRNNILYIILPSGRYLAYIKPFLRRNKFDKVSVAFKGQDQITKQWLTQDTYGGKLVENIVQATARDVLADAMLRLDQAGFELNMHVHDEVVMEVDAEESPNLLKKAGEIMGHNIPWVKGLPLAAKSFLTPYYLKD